MDDSYAGLSSHYDIVMTSGYYDYEAYCRAMVRLAGHRANWLEVGVGTGLVCEKLLELGETSARITGIDPSESMLAPAQRRLGNRVVLEQQDVLRLALPPVFDVAYSVGGVWAYTPARDEVRLASLLLSESENRQALENVRNCLKPGGMLLLASQRPHVSSRRQLSNGLVFTQEVREEAGGHLVKDYRVTDGDAVVASQRSRIRSFTEHQADSLVRQSGFHFQQVSDDGLVHVFTRQQS